MSVRVDTTGHTPRHAACTPRNSSNRHMVTLPTRVACAQVARRCSAAPLPAAQSRGVARSSPRLACATAVGADQVRPSSKLRVVPRISEARTAAIKTTLTMALGHMRRVMLAGSRGRGGAIARRGRDGQQCWTAWRPRARSQWWKGWRRLAAALHPRVIRWSDWTAYIETSVRTSVRPHGGVIYNGSGAAGTRAPA